MTTRALAFALLLTVPSAVAAADDTRSATSLPAIPSIVRFSQVDDRLYRGGQPALDDYAKLRDMGITTVVSLREEDDERAAVEALGMKWVHLPMTMAPFGMSGEVSKANVEAFFNLVDDPANGKVFIHCRHGKDRTGLFVSLYRITRQGWDVDEAYREARSIGMSWWHRSNKDTMERFALDDDN